NGVAASQYQYYRFYDFRQMKSAGHGHSNTKGLQSKVVSDSSWKNDWYIRDYPRKSPGGYSIPVNFIPERVFISTFPYFPTRKTAAQQTTANATDPSTNSTSHLSLNTARIDSETQDSGEILFKEFNISYASLRVYSRVHGAPGAVAGIFTYLNDTQESDIEVFTRAPSTFIQYSNQPASSGEPDWTPIPGATVNVSLSSGQVKKDRVNSLIPVGLPDQLLLENGDLKLLKVPNVAREVKSPRGQPKEGIRQDCLDELTVILAKPFAEYEASGDTLEVGIDVSTLVVDHESKV
ncbi:hypothetical protein N0V87_007195, partial [Didymella glomerata]